MVKTVVPLISEIKKGFKSATHLFYFSVCSCERGAYKEKLIFGSLADTLAKWRKPEDVGVESLQKKNSQYLRYCEF